MDTAMDKPGSNTTTPIIRTMVNGYRVQLTFSAESNEQIIQNVKKILISTNNSLNLCRE